MAIEVAAAVAADVKEAEIERDGGHGTGNVLEDFKCGSNPYHPPPLLGVEVVSL